MGIAIPLVLIFVCCLVIWRACDGFEVASEYLGRNLSEGVRGGTINAISSSIPELLTTVIALFFLSDEEGFAIGLGTTAGSAIFNGMIIPAVCIFAVVGSVIAGVKVATVSVSSKVILRDGLSLLFCELIVILLISGTQLHWWHGLILMMLYLIYLSYMLLSMKQSTALMEEDNESEGQKVTEEDNHPSSLIQKIFYWSSGGPVLDLERWFIRSSHQSKMASETWNAWPLLLVSTSFVGLACYFLVIACEWLGSGPGNTLHPSYQLFGHSFEGIGMAPIFVAVIFASMATSVPDTVMSIRDARDGDYDDAVANALGSNIFDLCFALGCPVFFYTLTFGSIEITEVISVQVGQILLILLALTLAAFLVYFVGPRCTNQDGSVSIQMGRGTAAFLLLLYVTFVLYIIGTVVQSTWATTVSNCLTAVLNWLPRT